MCSPLSTAHKRIVLLTHKRRTSFLNFFLKSYNILQKLLFQSKWMHNFNKYKSLLSFSWNIMGCYKVKTFFWKGYFLPFLMRYSFLCCCKYLLRYIFFLFEQSKSHQFWTRGKWVKLLTSLWTETLCPQNKSGREIFTLAYLYYMKRPRKFNVEIGCQKILMANPIMLACL